MLKKCSVFELIDNIFWGLLLIFPLLSYVIYLMGDNVEVISLMVFLTDIIPIAAEGTIFDTFQTLFIEYMPFFSSMSWIAVIFTWFVFVEFAHVVFDVIVFLPRLCHNWVSRFGGKIS